MPYIIIVIQIDINKSYGIIPMNLISTEYRKKLRQDEPDDPRDYSRLVSCILSGVSWRWSE